MPKSKEYVSSGESNSSEDEKPTKKKQKSSSDSKKSKSADKEVQNSSKTSNQSDEEPTWELGNMRRVCVREFKGKLMIDIREMYMDNNSGEMKPGRKGIALNTAQFKKLVSCMDEIEQAVQAKS